MSGGLAQPPVLRLVCDLDRDHPQTTPAMSSLHAVAVVPARYDSQRFPGKVLADIGGDPLIRWVYERAARARKVDRAYVATDSERVEAACRPFTNDIWLSKAAHACGTDRVAEVAREVDADVFVNVQTDEPMMDPDLVDALIDLVDGEGVDFASAVAPIREMKDFLDPNVVKVVCDARGDALYFSRAPIPWPREVHLAPDEPWPSELRAFKHIGIYAYRREALLDLAALPRSEAEVTESLEQLRVLDQGWKMRILEWDYKGIGVDTESDLERIRNSII
jgi:3-deoxy-manno-octulosonate cytidylyltransferase (CMP-KDO synthetase)